MLFAPLRFYGWRIPGLRTLYAFLPRRVQVIPAITSDGRFGWQGIVPSRAEKMASIAVDKSLAKLGSISDFYEQLEPDLIANHLALIAKSEIRGVITKIMEREDPQLWHNLPPALREMMFKRIENQLPQIIKNMTDQIGENIEQLVDAKLMIIRYLTAHPKLLNDIFRTMGHKELQFMQNFGFYFGYPMGFVLVAILHSVPQHWWTPWIVLPLGGVIIGYIVNYLGITMIFEPVHPNKWVPWRQPVHKTQGRDLRGIRAHHLRERHHPGKHRRRDAQRTPLGSHPADARRRHPAGAGASTRTGSARHSGSGRPATVRPDHRIGHPGSNRLCAPCLFRSGIQQATSGQDRRLRLHPDAQALTRRFQRVAALGGQAGRVVAVRTRRRSGRCRSLAHLLIFPPAG